MKLCYISILDIDILTCLFSINNIILLFSILFILCTFLDYGKTYFYFHISIKIMVKYFFYSIT